MRRRLPALVATVVAGLAVSLVVAGAPRVVLTPADAAVPPPTGEYDAAVSMPVEDPYYPAKGDPGVDALHYDLDLSWAPRRGVLTGVATIDLRSVVDQSQLILDLSDALTATEVSLDGAPADFEQQRQHLVVTTAEVLAADSRHQLVVVYAGEPKPSHTRFNRADIAKLGWHTTKDGSTWTMQEPFGAFTWYPVNDHPSDKAFYTATVSAPARMVGVFNGDLLSDTTADGRRITSWQLDSPAASYLVTLAIGDYVRYDDAGPDGVPLSYWLERDHSARELRTARFLPKAMTWLTEHLGPYPFDRAGIVETPGGSAMETQTLLTMSRSVLKTRNRAVVLHELAHHWYGDTVTPDSWKDLWLNEGWAMYTQLRWEAEHDGMPMRYWRSYLAEADGLFRRQYGPPGEFDRRDFATIGVYYCGALMIDQLRKKIGSEAFADLWREWPQQHLDSNADRTDWIAWASARSGVDLEPFITEWLTSEKTPVLL